MNIEILLEKLSNPAKRAILSLNIKKIENLSKFTSEQISNLHGLGPTGILVIEKEMKTLGVKYKPAKTKMDSSLKFKTVDEYIKSFPLEIRKILTDMRNTVKKSAGAAKEKISYNMPALELNGSLVYYAAFKKHIGFYHVSNATQIFADELAAYKFSKGAIQFPFDKPLPKGLISKIVKLRVKENLDKSKS